MELAKLAQPIPVPCVVFDRDVSVTMITVRMIVTVGLVITLRVLFGVRY